MLLYIDRLGVSEVRDTAPARVIILTLDLASGRQNGQDDPEHPDRTSQFGVCAGQVHSHCQCAKKRGTDRGPDNSTQTLEHRQSYELLLRVRPLSLVEASRIGVPLSWMSRRALL